MVRVIARQLSGKNCLAAIFASRHQDASPGPLGGGGRRSRQNTNKKRCLSQIFSSFWRVQKYPLPPRGLSQNLGFSFWFQFFPPLSSEIPRRRRSRAGRCANLSQTRHICAKLRVSRFVHQRQRAQTCRKFENRFRTILCKYPFSYAPFSKFLISAGSNCKSGFSFGEKWVLFLVSVFTQEKLGNG